MSGSPGPDRAVLGARVVATIFLAAIAGVVVYVIAARFSFPGELEWMTGAIVDHVERVRNGQPIYAAPSADWIPFIYTPGYYWACATVSRVLPIVAACRLVSIVSSAITAVCTYFLAKNAGASRYQASLAPLLFVACFGYVCAWYDIERADALLVAMLALAAVALQRARSSTTTAVSGALVGLAFFVKQPATTFIVVVPLVLLVGQLTKRALAFGGGAALAIVPTFVWLQASTKGWFSFYCLALPRAHGMAAKYITTFFIVDLSKALLLTVATLGAFAWLVARVRDRIGRRDVAVDPRKLVLVAFLAAGFVASATSRLHVGGWPNVLVFWTTFAVPTFAVLATRLESLGSKTVTCVVLAATALQAGAFVPDPNEAVPDDAALVATRAFDARIAALETEGDVLCLGRGHVTRKRHPHLNALVDVMRAGKPVPADLREAIAGRRFAAIVIDDLDDIRMQKLLDRESELFSIVAGNYFIAEHIDDRAPMPVVGFPTLPRIVLRPRKAPIALDHDALVARQLVELGLAEANMRAAQAHQPVSDGLDIETRAAER
ncbi:MAG TPA: glycosyltransferase 87 family protein [Polyangiaceae bacterium]|nr:glycosyltransferase 87 family protein [Polyangiaceae bacterium]